MTDNYSFKKTVRQFADVNGVKYTTALRQFDPTSGEPLYALVDEFGGDEWRQTEQREATWARRLGLTRATSSVCLHQVASATGRTSPQHSYTLRDECATWSTGRGAVKDHGRVYLFRGAADARRRPAVVTFAPYAAWNDEELLEELDELCVQFDLAYRIGFASDITYGSTTPPIVIWNPRVIDLPLLAD